MLPALFHLTSSILLLSAPKKVRNINLKKLNFERMIKINWSTIVKVLKFIATVITSVAGTLAVQSCAPYLF